ncbi:DNA polymerase I [Candidatus Haliotispira prima]|uniref:DNA polymerase I n=1 Tax=Candidatus Haliotispira prima TaxID=3034016 RepID=A0ABY8MHY1_9SPIO|nr:DNA polymerase I [Candidatus Haliotispira prima]
MPKAPLYLIDGFAIIFRNYYAMIRSPLTNLRGENVSALLGFVKQVQQVLRHAQEHDSRHVAMVLDSEGQNFRHKIYPEYKANRDEAPADLILQIQSLARLLELWGIPTYKHPDYEADDLIATLARRAGSEGRDCFIVTGDKDLYQLVDSHIRILKPDKGRFGQHDADYVTEKWGVEPRQIRDYLALVGDSADNVPGVSGIGPKGAVKLLSDYQNLDNIYANMNRVKPDGIRKKLEAGKESAALSYRLVGLADRIPELEEQPWSQLWQELELPEKVRSGKGAPGNPGFALFLQELGLNKLALEFDTAVEKQPAEGRAEPDTMAATEGTESESTTQNQNTETESEEISGNLFRQQSLALTPPALRNKAREQQEDTESSPEQNPEQDPQQSPQQDQKQGPEADDRVQTAEQATGIPVTPTEVLQSYECVTTEEQLERWCQRIARQKIVAIDTETTGLNELADDLVGISLATAKNQACYIPLRANQANRTGGANVPLLTAQQVQKALAGCLSPEVKIIGQNFKFDYKVLANWGLKVPAIHFDTMIAAWLLDSLHPVNMNALSVRYLNLEPIHFDGLLPKMPKTPKTAKTAKKSKKSKDAETPELPENAELSEVAELPEVVQVAEVAENKEEQTPQTFADVPLEQAVHYSAEDADITWQLYEHFAPLLREQGLETLFFDLEMPLVRILGEIELSGIGCNRQELERYAIELEAELAGLENKVTKLTGREFNLNSTQQLAEILFNELKLPAGKKTKTGYSTNNSVLEKLLDLHPVIAPILEYRRLNKLHSTYVKSLPEMILPKTQRIHTHFSVIGTETGRLSCKDPNLQNIPIRDAAGRRIRSAFRPQEGWGFFSADYSQIELVVLAHLSADPGLCRAFLEGRDIHRETAGRLFCVPPDKISADQRRIAKSINFGVIYGMSAFRLARDLNLTRNDAKSFIATYFHEFSGVKDFIARTIDLAEEQGCVHTLAGRRREIRQIRSNNKIERGHGERMAVNTVVQGSAADIVKQAMILLDGELAHKKADKGWQSRLLLQVHDELIFEVPPAEKAQIESLVPDIMENACELEVPLKVNGEWSTESWGELH